MDTSIIVVIAIAVVFVVAVPAMIRRSATELSRVDIDRVPDQAQVIDAEALPPCRDHTARARVFHPDTSVEPAVPRSLVESQAEAPRLNLSAPVPQLSVIDGDAERSLAEVTPESPRQAQPLPVAVGQAQPSYRADLSQEHRAAREVTANQSGNVRRLHPAVHAVFAQSGLGSSQQPDPAHGTRSRSIPGPGPASPGRGAAAAGTSGGGHGARPAHSNPQHSGTGRAKQSGRAPGAGGLPRSEQELRTTKRNFGADEELSMTENTTALQESMSALGTMIRGFSLVLLASLLGILVTGVLALFSLVHPALLGVFAGLSVISLLIVRTLNMRKWELKRQLRALDESRGSSAAAPRQAPVRASQDGRGSEARPAASPAVRSTATQRAGREAQPTGRSAGARPAAQRAGRSTETRPAPEPKAAATVPAATTAPAASVKAAQARAVIERNASAKRAREEATTGEIPVVRIRNEAAAGHTTRQVLLTGPIPTLEDSAARPETAPEDADASTGTETTAAAPDQAEKPLTESDSTRETAARSDSARPAAGPDAADDATSGSATAPAGTSARVTGAEAADGPEAGRTASERDGAATVSDPFTQRLKARDGWSPTPLPVPSYVGAPEVDQPVPAARKADVTSYEIEPRSREDIAAQFAAELGYRPELSDSAREEGPLAHGRTAIRATKAPELGAVNDVLARRRA